MSEKEISEKMQDIMKRMKTRREELNMSYQTLSEKWVLVNPRSKDMRPDI